MADMGGLVGNIGGSEDTSTKINQSWDQRVAGGAAQGAGQSIALGSGATLTLSQQSPAALGALETIAGQALATGQQAIEANKGLSTKALDTAATLGAPVTSITKYVAIAAVVLGAFFLLRRR